MLTPEEERDLLTSFWDCKSELVRVLLRHFPNELRACRPPLEPWPMAQFIREHCTDERSEVIAVRRLLIGTCITSTVSLPPTFVSRHTLPSDFATIRWLIAICFKKRFVV